MATLAAAVLACAGCDDGGREFAGGYRFVALSKGNGAILRSGHLIVYPDVVAAAARGRYVIGRRVATRDTDGAPLFTRATGWFVLDTATGRLRQGLARDAAERAAR